MFSLPWSLFITIKLNPFQPPQNPSHLFLSLEFTFIHLIKNLRHPYSLYLTPSLYNEFHMNYSQPTFPFTLFPHSLSLSSSFGTPLISIMSWRNRSSNQNHQELDLKLNLSSSGPARRPAERVVESPEVSPERSCVSSDDSLKYSSSPESSSMVVVGCPRCLMYVMLSEADHRCPKCKSTVLLDFHRQNDVVINEKPRRRN